MSEDGDTSDIMDEIWSNATGNIDGIQPLDAAMPDLETLGAEFPDVDDSIPRSEIMLPALPSLTASITDISTHPQVSFSSLAASYSTNPGLPQMFPTIGLPNHMDEDLLASVTAAAVSASTASVSIPTSDSVGVHGQSSRTITSSYQDEASMGDAWIAPNKVGYAFREVDGEGIHPDFVGIAVSIGRLVASRYSNLSEKEQKGVVFVVSAAIVFGPAIFTYGLIETFGAAGFIGTASTYAEMARQGRKNRLEDN